MYIICSTSLAYRCAERRVNPFLLGELRSIPRVNVNSTTPIP